MGRFLIVFSFLAASLGLTDRTWAWNSVGHLATAKLAYDHLEDGQKTSLFKLLKYHPHFETFLAAGRPENINEVEWAVLRASLWPDWIRPRGSRDPRGYTVIGYHRGEEHYINVPFIDPKDEKFFAGKILVQPDSTNLLCALKQRCNDLKLKTAGYRDKAIAICWIFHLVGDIHQPMHNVTYFSSDPTFLGGDLGGNKFGVQANGHKVKLHLFWDELLGEDPDYTNDTSPYQVKIFQQAMTVATGLRGLKLAQADQDKLARNQTFASWSQESFDLARTVAYQKEDGSGLLPGVEATFKGVISDKAPELGADYIRRARTTAEVRIVMAGHRLAERIKMLIGK